MAADLTTTLSASLIVTDVMSSPSPQIITRSLNNPTLANHTVGTYIPFHQGGTVTLPAATVFIAYVKNLQTAGNITVSFTPVGAGAASSVLLLPGGVFLYFLPAVTGGGISALSTSAASTAEVYVAA
jgi:hypothetical protein